jgi:acylphosphatase
MLKQVRVYIKGDVIGVGFRAWTKIQAKILGVNGWVKNVYNQPERFGVGGGVEILAQGDEEKIKNFLNLVKQGPPIARVEEVEVINEDPKEVFHGFEIKK